MEEALWMINTKQVAKNPFSFDRNLFNHTTKKKNNLNNKMQGYLK